MQSANGFEIVRNDRLERIDPRTNLLMAGEEIFVKADISKGVPPNAVKFKQLELKIISSDGNHPFDSILTD